MKIYPSLPAVETATRKFGIKNATAIEANGLVFLSGWTAVDLETGEMFEGPFERHAHMTLDIVARVLTDLGLSLDNVVKVNCYLADPKDFRTWNDVYLARFQEPYPCRTTVGAPLVAGAIEVDIVASRESRLTAERG